MSESIKFSICTPWLPPRMSIYDSIRYVDEQTYNNWEHLITIDRPGYAVDAPEDTRRHILPCENGGHNTWGNTCRHIMWEKATGDWIIYLDDDDILYPNALEKIAEAIENDGQDRVWGYFKIKLGAGDFFHVPAGGGLITGGQIFHKKYGHMGEQLRWFDTPNYAGDWDHIYQHFVKPGYDPILIPECLGKLPKHGKGEV